MVKFTSSCELEHVWNRIIVQFDYHYCTIRFLSNNRFVFSIFYFLRLLFHMDPESSSFSTADYSFYQDPPDNNDWDVNNITPFFNDTFDSSTLGNSENNSKLSLRTLDTYSFPLHFDKSCVIEIEFDAGLTPPCAACTLPPFFFFVCGQSLLTLDSICSFDLKDTVLYPVPVNYKERGSLKSCQIYECNKDENYYRFPFYRTIKFNHPYRIYSFWNTQI
jgi:hypothetical protein